MIEDSKDILLKTLNAALQSKQLYPPGHPSVAAPAKKTVQLLSEHFLKDPTLIISLVDEEIVFDNIPVEDGPENFEELYEDMKAKQVESLIFERGLTEREMSAFLDILSSEKEYK
ncbi:MAG: hypothetical protein KAR06_06740, partial [Deltaproteobacteria bacterium]|nr:hypothetical protein [Deltaproteobacteria bacterium]